MGKYMTEHQPVAPLSEEMQALLQKEALEAEILAAMDAAAEEGLHITREDAIQVLLEKQKNLPQEDQTPNE